MSKYWFVKTSGGIAGPFTFAKLGKLTAAGRIKPAVAISTDQETWLQADQVDGLVFPTHSTPQQPANPPAELPSRLFEDARIDQYARYFGQCDQVVRGEVDVRVYPANSIRPITTLVTSGLSEHAFAKGIGPISARRELVLYVDKYYAAYAKLLQCLATALIVRREPFGYGAVIPNKEPAKPIFRGGDVDHFLLMIPSVAADFAIRNTLAIDSQPLHLIWMVPITAGESVLVKGQGMQAFCQLLDRMQHGLTVKPKRGCYARSAQANGLHLLQGKSVFQAGQFLCEPLAVRPRAFP